MQANVSFVGSVGNECGVLHLILLLSWSGLVDCGT